MKRKRFSVEQIVAVMNHLTEGFRSPSSGEVETDSTLRSNLTVGLPIYLLVYKKAAFRVDIRRRLGEDDPYFRKVREDWSTALREAYLRRPRPDWAQ